jgi:hypothetical protein
MRENEIKKQNAKMYKRSGNNYVKLYEDQKNKRKIKQDTK